MYPVEFAYERINYPDSEIVDLLEDDFISEKINTDWEKGASFLLKVLADEIKAKYNLSELRYYGSDGIGDFIRKIGNKEDTE